MYDSTFYYRIAALIGILFSPLLMIIVPVKTIGPDAVFLGWRLIFFGMAEFEEIDGTLTLSVVGAIAGLVFILIGMGYIKARIENRKFEKSKYDSAFLERIMMIFLNISFFQFFLIYPIKTVGSNSIFLGWRFVFFPRETYEEIEIWFNLLIMGAFITIVCIMKAISCILESKKKPRKEKKCPCCGK